MTQTPDQQSVTIACASLDETEALARRLAGALKIGDVVLLEGTLAAGKTTFVSDICRAFGIEGQPSSPTYVISNVYDAPGFEVYHIDAYRLAGAREFGHLGLDEFFPDAITFIEWGDRVAEAFDTYLRVEITRETGAEDARRFRFTGHGARWAPLITRLAGEAAGETARS